MTDLRPLAPPWRIGIDVGGTFTDMVLTGRDGEIRVFKVPSVPDDQSLGVRDVILQAAARSGLGVERLLGECSLFVHGSTVATNMLLEKKGARVGLLTTQGFRDSLEIRRSIRRSQWDHRAPMPDVLVPRSLRIGIPGRIDSRGVEVAPLDRDAVRRAVQAFRQAGVEAVAICFINSYIEPKHEREAAEIVAAGWPDAWVSISAAGSPQMGEYERSSTAVIDAYVGPKTVSYLRSLAAKLEAMGLRRSLLVLQSNGGALSIDQVSETPSSLLLSGPSAAVGALKFCRGLLDDGDMISMEIGGTSCDVTLMSSGEVPLKDELEVDGYHANAPSADIHTVGAGGGTIARAEAGLLAVGPTGAGARPGPACFGRGGTLPTVTDAQLVLGRLMPGPYAKGAVHLDLDRAHEAIDTHVARPLGIDCLDAAIGIIRLTDEHLIHAIERVTIERGQDPRRFTLLGVGGAGPMHVASVARALGCRRAYVPRIAGAFCALGMVNSDVRQDFGQVLFGGLDRVPDPEVEAAFRRLEEKADGTLAREGFAERGMVERYIELRYRGQQWSLRVPSHGLDRLDRDAVRVAFEAEHQRLYGHRQALGTIEMTRVVVIARGVFEPLGPSPEERTSREPAALDMRDVMFDRAAGWIPTRIVKAPDLQPGDGVEGPFIVEEETTTLIGGPGDHLIVDPFRNYLLTLETRA